MCVVAGVVYILGGGRVGVFAWFHEWVDARVCPAVCIVRVVGCGVTWVSRVSASVCVTCASRALSVHSDLSFVSDLKKFRNYAGSCGSYKRTVPKRK